MTCKAREELDDWICDHKEACPADFEDEMRKLVKLHDDASLWIDPDAEKLRGLLEEAVLVVNDLLIPPRDPGAATMRRFNWTHKVAALGVKPGGGT